MQTTCCCCRARKGARTPGPRRTRCGPRLGSNHRADRSRRRPQWARRRREGRARARRVQQGGRWTSQRGREHQRHPVLFSRAPPRPRSAWMPSSALRPTVKPGTYGSKASVHAGVCAPPVLDARALLRPGVESRSGLALQIRALTRARPARVLAGGARRDQGHSAGIHRTASNPAPAPQRSASAEGRIARAPSAGDAVLPFPPGGSICLPALSSSPLMLRTHF